MLSLPLLLHRFPSLLSRSLPGPGVAAAAGAVCRIHQSPDKTNVTRCWEQNPFYPVRNALLVKSDTSFTLK